MLFACKMPRVWYVLGNVEVARGGGAELIPGEVELLGATPAGLTALSGCRDFDGRRPPVRPASPE